MNVHLTGLCFKVRRSKSNPLANPDFDSRAKAIWNDYFFSKQKSDRYYFSDVIGTGQLVVDPYRASVSAVLPSRAFYCVHDTRNVLPIVTGPASGQLFVCATLTGEEHENLIRNASVQYVKMINSTTGAVLGLNDTVGLMSTADQSALTTVLESKHIPQNDRTTGWTIKQVIQRIVRRMRVRQACSSDDLNNHTLDATTGNVTLAQSTALQVKLPAAGYSLAAFSVAIPVRTGLIDLCSQEIPRNQSSYD